MVCEELVHCSLLVERLGWVREPNRREILLQQCDWDKPMGKATWADESWWSAFRWLVLDERREGGLCTGHYPRYWRLLVFVSTLIILSFCHFSVVRPEPGSGCLLCFWCCSASRRQDTVQDVGRWFKNDQREGLSTPAFEHDQLEQASWRFGHVRRHERSSDSSYSSTEMPIRFHLRMEFRLKF